MKYPLTELFRTETRISEIELHFYHNLAQREQIILARVLATVESEIVRPWRKILNHHGKAQE